MCFLGHSPTCVGGEEAAAALAGGDRDVEDVELLDGVVEAVSGEAVDGRPGERHGDWADD